MLNLKIVRTEFENRTEGDLFVNGEYFCKTLEDKVRDTKIPHETAIPYGIYQMILSYSPKFKRQMPLICNVPNFEGVRIHAGNTIEDTWGCILVGEYIKDGFLYNSAKTFKKILEIIGNNQDIQLEIC